MGSTIPEAETIAFTVDVVDLDGEDVTLELFDRWIVVASTTLTGAVAHTWTVAVPGTAGHFYFVRATQADGDVAYTSPIWTSGVAAPDVVLLNEFAPPHDVDWDGDGTADHNDEWIELYNSGPTAVGLAGWQLDDVAQGGSAPYTIPAGTVIQPGGFLVFFKRESGRSKQRGREASSIFARVSRWRRCQSARGRLGRRGRGSSSKLRAKRGRRWRDAICLDDGSGEARVYIKKATGIEKPWVEKGQEPGVVGIVSQCATEAPYEGGYRLLPRYQSDFILSPLKLPVTGGSPLALPVALALLLMRTSCWLAAMREDWRRD